MSDREDALRFLTMFTEGCSSGYVGLTTFTSPGKAQRRSHTRFFAISDLGALVDEALTCAPDWEVYVCSGVFGTTPGRGRGKTEDVSFYGACTFDFDLKPGAAGHIADLDRLLEAAPHIPGPTLVLKTGGGLLPVWRLQEPFVIETQADRDEAAKLARAFGEELRSVAATTFGWKFDATQDLVRLVRLPGTYNHKYPHRPRVELLS